MTVTIGGHGLDHLFDLAGDPATAIVVMPKGVIRRVEKHPEQTFVLLDGFDCPYQDLWREGVGYRRVFVHPDTRVDRD